MKVYEVTVRNAAGRERVERVVAGTDESASAQAILRVERETGAKRGEWQAVHVA